MLPESSRRTTCFSRCSIFNVFGVAASASRPSPQLQELAFSGIHVISPRLLGKMSEEGAFSIVQSYLRLAGEGERILSYRADGDYWRDLGRPENVARVAEDLKEQAMLRRRDTR